MTLDDIARQAAEKALADAEAAGYQIKNARGPFIRSDIGSLSDDIAYWLEKTVEKAPAEQA